MLTEEQARQALSTVMDPELRRDIVSLGMVRDLRIAGHAIDLTLALTTIACPLRNRMGDDAVAALKKLDPDAEVQVHFAEMSAEEKQSSR